MNILRFKAYLGLAILLSFIGLLFCFRSISSAQSSPKMEFSIVLENSECKLEEPIYATFKLKNTGTIPAYVNKRFYLGSEEAPKEKREVFFIITSPLSIPMKRGCQSQSISSCFSPARKRHLSLRGTCGLILILPKPGPIRS
jgi:hypothetical protein